ncbi:FAD-dependent oxidoreductase [candidate division KSB1 bacterium]|nr:FAD-dependent oxidoreductase [candidate division KSB1 bacterium]
MKKSRRQFLTRITAGAMALLTGAGQAKGEFIKRQSAETGNFKTSKEISWNRSIPMRYDADVAIIGGGIAGVSAACAAAKSGARVILIERFGVVGGNSTTGGVASFCGETAGQGEVFDIIISDLEKFKAVAPYVPYPEADHRNFDHEILAVVFQELLLRRNVKLLLHTRFVDVVEQDGKISECIICGKSGPEALRAKQFIDCTGEAEVAHVARFRTMKGGDQNGLQLPMSVMCFVRHVEENELIEQVPEGVFKRYEKRKDLPMTSIWPNGPHGNALKIKVAKFDATDTESLTAAEIYGRRQMMSVIDYYQRVEKRPWRFDHCSPQIGIREGRRILGDYVLKVEDLRKTRKFDDAVARGTYVLDAHKPDDDKRTYILSKAERTVPPYQIPLRSLIAKDGKNLMMAGRCLSADQLALSSARVTTSCSMMGQAAGIAAAMSVENKCDPRDLDFSEIRKIVEKRGANLDV